MTTTENDPNGRVRYFADDETRTVKFYDAAGVLTSSTDYSAEMNAAADIRAFVRDQQEARETFLNQLATGLPQILTARDAAQADADAMTAAIADLTLKRDQVAAFAVPATYAAATITAIKNDLVAIRNTLIAQAQYRKAVDQNAVITDNALLWVAKVLTDQVLD